jgi:hypothetical protein
MQKRSNAGRRNAECIDAKCKNAKMQKCKNAKMPNAEPSALALLHCCIAALLH